MNSKFTVIIPTLWKSIHIHHMLEAYESCEFVGEIILIDNANAANDNLIRQYTKLTVLPQQENIYVNPAWNLGVSIANYNKIAIANDDILFNTDIFEWITHHMNTGVIGMCTSAYDPIDRNLPYEIEKIDKRPVGWGCLMFTDKQNYIPIPTYLRIACGDDYLMQHVIGGAYILKNLRVGGTMSATSLFGEYLSVADEDIKKYKQIFLVV